MGSKGGKKHLKKLAAPRKRKILRKDSVWSVKARAGPHPAKDSVPLLIIARDYLKLGDTAAEVEKIIKAKDILIDGTAITDPKFPVGFMDLVGIPKIKEQYRVVLDEKGRIVLHRIKEKADFKLCRIEGKSIIRKGKTQLNLHDGRNYLTEKEDYKVGDVLKMSVPQQKIIEHYSLKSGNLAYIISGKHAGTVGKIQNVLPGSITRRKLIEFKEKDKEFRTAVENVFVVGKDKPAITLK